ncbi:HK97-gp10 family putative phage morphogenesis protein [Pseudophaeobacter flagellatus]|uniref:HK97-gp10 family putative phage morphogenesis protein n=1 Tax=Pseudophaeobacter flagellatus TaxID=2899119 RepID=UPI001E2D1576|nr:HK97-gp10 family putative phage morphogenesis protein [Pseudophaeobacter flagellatus]MCD9148994.1 HK97 gp10 family phage protein [Pseudophaeobacter flagellatus]
MSMEMQLEGFSELEDALDDLSKSAGRGVLRRSLMKAAEPMADLMRSRAPHGQGDLEESIAVSSKLSKRQAAEHRAMFRDQRAAVEMFVGAGALPQAHQSEFGNEHQAPQPFARPAWDQDQQALLDRLGGHLWAEFEKSLARAQRKAAKG